MQDHVLTWREYEGRTIIVQDLVQTTEVATLLNNEEVIKGTCQDFKNLLMVMASLGGEKVIER